MDWMLFDNNVMPISDFTRTTAHSQLNKRMAYKGNLDTDFPASVCSPAGTFRQNEYGSNMFS